MGPSDPDEGSLFPRLAIGMVLHRPGEAPGRQAMAALRSITDDDIEPGYCGVDRAYAPGCAAEDFQVPADGDGWTLVFDYRDDQLGAVMQHHGAILVEGAWYCPAMPPDLVNATKIFRKDGDLDTYRERIAARRPYMMRYKDGPSGERFICPAEGPSFKLSCSLKEASTARDDLAEVPVKFLPKRPTTVCRSRYIRIEPEVGAKYRQELQYGTDYHHALYTRLRNTSEGLHGTAKSGCQELEKTSTRRVRGLAAQGLLTAFVVLAENVRRLRRFLEGAQVAEDGTISVPVRRRTPRKLVRPSGIRRRRAVSGAERLTT